MADLDAMLAEGRRIWHTREATSMRRLCNRRYRRQLAYLVRRCLEDLWVEQLEELLELLWWEADTHE